MTTIGTVGLSVSLVAALGSVVALYLSARQARQLPKAHAKRIRRIAGISVMQLVGSLCVLLVALALTVCCAVLVVAFLGGDNTIAYVAGHRSDSSSDLALLYKISGLWAGREGSLLLWAWLISLFNTIVTVKAWVSTARRYAPAESAGASDGVPKGRQASGSGEARKKEAATAPEPAATAESAAAEAAAAGEAPEAPDAGKTAAAAAVGTAQARPAMATAGAAEEPATELSKQKKGRSSADHTALDCAALAVSQLVLLAFVFILSFDEGNNPFLPTAAEYLGASGELVGNATLWGMNALLEHWAMAIHPPTLFIGYAGMTIPFAYAMGALIINDPSRAWVDRASRYALFSWLFLGIGIGLGAVWAYVVLGWGGYWGWDAVENASLLSWVVGVALIHSMTVYRQRGTFKRWTVMLTCLTFAFVIVGTFITRSGIVESVHAFAENPLSTVLFGTMIIVPILAGVIGLIVRRRSFGDEAVDSDEDESFAGKDLAYYLNNVIMVVCTILLAYMTLSSSLPSWMPFGGQTFTASSYNFIARPIGVIYCLIIAVCPLLSWRKTSFRSMLRQAWLPAIGALVVFILLCWYFLSTLLPIYMQTMAQQGTAAQALHDAGPFVYYAILTLLGFAAASILVFNSLVMIVRAVAKRNLRVQTIGGFLAHLAMGVMVIGLIGSSMYVYEKVGYLPYDEATDVASGTFEVRGYTLSYVSNAIEATDNDDDILYSVTFDVERDGEHLGQVTPSIQLVQSTNQKMKHAAVLSLPTEDIFVVYNGVNDEGSFSLDVRINPLIWFVWAGFGLLMAGSAIAAFGRRKG